MKSARTIISALVLAGVAIGILGANASDRFITNTLTQQWEPIFTGTGDLAPSKNLLRFTTSGGVDVIPDPLFGASTCTCYISDFRLPRVTWTVSVDAKQAIASSALPPDSEFLTYIRSVQQDFLFPFEVRYDFCRYVKVTPAGSSIGYSAFEVTRMRPFVSPFLNLFPLRVLNPKARLPTPWGLNVYYLLVYRPKLAK